MDVLTHDLTKELNNEDIKINTVQPKLIDTEIHTNNDQPNRAERLDRTTPLKHAKHAKEIAETII